jgi:hypothetical protein
MGVGDDAEMLTPKDFRTENPTSNEELLSPLSQVA